MIGIPAGKKKHSQLPINMAFLPLIPILGVAAAQAVDYSQFVNPFIGSEGAIPGYACMSTPMTSYQQELNVTHCNSWGW